MEYSEDSLIQEISKFVPSVHDMLQNKITLPTICRLAAVECFLQWEDSPLLRKAIKDLEEDMFCFVE